MSESIDVYDGGNFKIIKKFNKDRFIQPFIGYLEKSKKVYISSWNTESQDTIINWK